MAEGVKCYSQRTWEICLQDQGPATIAQHIKAFVASYVATAEVDVHCHMCMRYGLCLRRSGRLPLFIQTFLIIVFVTLSRAEGQSV